MRLINVKALLEREELMEKRERVDRRAKVLEFCDDDVTAYAILSHRWIGQEVDYDEIVELAKMDEEKRDEIRQREGYRKILDSCKQAEKDGYQWLWVDTCCIDKRSSAELSEAINSMYRWYENAHVCYAYLHDVLDSSFPVARNDERYASGWPEWFSRGWTLQEMIAPSNVQFFNKKWQAIGDKWTFARTLENITGVPEHILTDGLSVNRPCVAQIMSWAADRTTTRVEDIAYSLMGLLDVNMPMLYGEGKKAFHRLQLEIIRTSNDQSIFAWNWNSKTEMRTGSILAEDPSVFRCCSEMELMDPDEFIEYYLPMYMPGEELGSIEKDRLGTFPITNRGIQIWLFLVPHYGSHTIFHALLPCRSRPFFPPVIIDLRLWESDYYRYTQLAFHSERTLQFRQVYLKYQATSHHRNASFEIDDSTITENGFVCLDTLPSNFTGNTFTLTSTDPLCVKVYSNDQTGHSFAVGFGQCFGKGWLHVVSEGWDRFRTEDAPMEYDKMLARALEHSRSMDRAHSRDKRYDRVCVMQTRLHQLTLRTSFVVWKSSRKNGIKFEVFRDPGFSDVSSEWTGFDVDKTDDRDWRALMIHDRKAQDTYELRVDGVSVTFSKSPEGIKLGDYGHFSDCEDFRCEGNIFTDLESLPSMEGIAPRQHRLSQIDGYQDPDRVHACLNVHAFIALYRPLCLSLPINDDVKTRLTSLSIRSANRYLVTRVIQAPPDPLWPSLSITSLCTFAKPFVWSRNEGADSALEERSGDDDRARVNDAVRVDETEL